MQLKRCFKASSLALLCLLMIVASSIYAGPMLFFHHAFEDASFLEVQKKFQLSIERSTNNKDKLAQQFSLSTLYLTYGRADLLKPLLDQIEAETIEQPIAFDSIKWHFFNAYYFFYRGQYEDADSSFSVALNTFETLSEEQQYVEEAQYLLTVLTLYSSLNQAYLQQYSLAIDRLTSLHLFADEKELPLISGMSLYHLAIISYELKNYEQALEYYQQAQSSLPQQAKQFIARAKMGEAQMINIVGERQHAFALLDEVIDVLSEFQDIDSLAYAYLLKSYFYSKDGNQRETLTWIEESITLMEQLGNDIDIANAYVHYSYTLFELGELDKGLIYGKRAVDLVAPTDDLAGQWDAYNNYGTILAAKESFQEAFYYMSKAERALLAKARLDITSEAARLNAHFNLEKEQLTNQYLDEKNKLLQDQLTQEKQMQARQTYTILALIVFVAMILLLMLIIYRLYLTNKSLAVKDALTGLSNRRRILGLGERLFKISQRDKQNLCLLMIDIDNFKQVNDTYGHDVGDKVLLFLTKVLTSVVRKPNLVGRLGGEEFMIVLPNSNEKEGLQLAEQLREECKLRLAESNIFSGDLTFSAGLANNNSDFTSFEALSKAADIALYKAKNSGRDQLQIADNNVVFK